MRCAIILILLSIGVTCTETRKPQRSHKHRAAKHAKISPTPVPDLRSLVPLLREEALPDD